MCVVFLSDGRYFCKWTLFLFSFEQIFIWNFAKIPPTILMYLTLYLAFLLKYLGCRTMMKSCANLWNKISQMCTHVTDHLPCMPPALSAKHCTVIASGCKCSAGGQHHISSSAYLPCLYGFYERYALMSFLYKMKLPMD